MNYGTVARGFGWLLNGMLKDAGIGRDVRRSVRDEYRRIVERSGDIGSRNNLLTSYVFAAYFIAMCRNTGLTPEENLGILQEGMDRSHIVRMFMGDADSYFSERRMEERHNWAESSHLSPYKNDWEFDMVEVEGDGFGMDYTRCGICELCRDERCPELAKYMCRTDFLLADIIGVNLERTGTIAEGAEKCDFRYYRK